MQNSPANVAAIRPCRTAWQQKRLGLDVTAPAVQEMAEEAEHFAGRWFRNHPTPAVLVLVGPSGVGKSHTAEAVVRFANQAGHAAWEQGHWKNLVPSSAFYRWPEIADAFKRGEYGVVDDMMGLSLIVLDDIGAEHDPSRNAMDKLCQVLSRREKRFTLVTTNISPDVWPERFDVRVADRLFRNSRIVDLSDVHSYALVS